MIFYKNFRKIVEIETDSYNIDDKKEFQIPYMLNKFGD